MNTCKVIIIFVSGFFGSLNKEPNITTRRCWGMPTRTNLILWRILHRLNMLQYNQVKLNKCTIV